MGAPLHLPKQLLPSGASFRAWLDQDPDAHLVTDPAGSILYANPAFERLAAYRSEELIGQRPGIFKSGVHDAPFYRSLWRTLLEGRAFHGLFVNRRKDGLLFHAESVIWPVFDARARITNFVCRARDVGERERDARRLAHAATHDPLTDLPNRALFLDRLELGLRLAGRRGEALALAIVDVDRFRDINTRHGHLAGDVVLQVLASRCASCAREADTVARIGGDEFAVILPGADRAGAAKVLEKIRASVALPLSRADGMIRPSVSIGASVFPRDGIEADALRDQADRAMYAAKRAGGNNVRFDAAVRAPLSFAKAARSR